MHACNADSFRIYLRLETTPSLPPESAGSKSPERQRQGVFQFPRARRSLFLLRSSDSAQLSSWAVLHSSVVESRVCGEGRSKSPCTAVACFECRLNLVAPDGDGAARRWGRNPSSVVSAMTRRETPPLAAEAAEAAISSTLNPAAPSEGNCGEGKADGNSVDAGSSKETSCRRSCREGNGPQPLEVAALLNLAAANVLLRGSATCKNWLATCFALRPSVCRK